MKTDDFFHFKDDRDYISSSNLLDFILADLKAVNPKNMDFRLSRFTRNRCYLETDRAKAIQSANHIGIYKDDNTIVFIMESQEKVYERRPYDEKGLVLNFSITQEGVRVPVGISGFTFMEKANAAFKALLKQRVFPDRPKRYIFVRLVLDFLPNDGFTIQYKRMVGGIFHDGEIIIGNKAVGHIYFSAKDKV